MHKKKWGHPGKRRTRKFIKIPKPLYLLIFFTLKPFNSLKFPEKYIFLFPFDFLRQEC